MYAASFKGKWNAMEIVLRRIQSARDLRYSFPDKGLVQIIGPNSGGKSILTKAIEAVIKCEITKQEVRDSLITDGEMAGAVIMEYHDKVLCAHLDRERNKCYYKLVRADGTEVIRTIRDGGLQELVYEFGWRVYRSGSIALQLCSTFGDVPFVTTPDTCNYEIVEEIGTDTVAQNFISTFKEVTYEKAKKVLNKLKLQITERENFLNTVRRYDWKAYAELGERMQQIYNTLKWLEPFELPELRIPPKITFVDIKSELLPELPQATVYPISELLPNSMDKVLHDLQIAREGKCPTCGRLLIECGGE